MDDAAISARTGFGRELACARRAAGYPSAYRFYHGQGGRRSFPFTYDHYLRFERGSVLPKPAWMALLLALLGAEREAARSLARIYLGALLGGEATRRVILDLAADPPVAL
ncbi:MAG: hypothetical protein HY928_01905 [Elusimicrobia bacterium]|nr:hypothetical protein [Elusimicrobiota bacterium]